MPAAFRTAIDRAGLEKTVYMFPSTSAPCLEGGDAAQFERWMQAIYRDAPALGRGPRDVARRVLGRAEPITWDNDGRIILSQQLREAAGITDRLTFIGVGYSFEVWNPDRLAAQDAQVDEEALQRKLDEVGPLEDAGGQS